MAEIVIMAIMMLAVAKAMRITIITETHTEQQNSKELK